MPCRLAIPSMSLGRCAAGHSLEHKLDMAQKYGYHGIELFHDDLLDVAARLHPAAAPAGEPSPTAQLLAAEHIAQLCRARRLHIVCLQPLMHYEGLADRAAHARALHKLRLWIRLVRALGTDLIQIPSTFLPAARLAADDDHGTFLDLAVADLREAADLGLAASEPALGLGPVRFAYESLAWGTRVDVWERCWDVVRRVDRPNLGICLDTFHIAARLFADPTAPDGRTGPDAEERVRRSTAALIRQLDVAKLFYVQVVDGARLGRPLVDGHPFHDRQQHPRMSWSRNCRLFYGEDDRGAYMPVKEIARAIFQGLGFEGWVSLELFNTRMSEHDPAVPEELAARGAASWVKLKRDMNLGAEESSAIYGRISASL